MDPEILMVLVKGLHMWTIVMDNLLWTNDVYDDLKMMDVCRACFESMYGACV